MESSPGVSVTLGTARHHLHLAAKLLIWSWSERWWGGSPEEKIIRTKRECWLCSTQIILTNTWVRLVLYLDISSLDSLYFPERWPSFSTWSIYVFQSRCRLKSCSFLKTNRYQLWCQIVIDNQQDQFLGIHRISRYEIKSTSGFTSGLKATTSLLMLSLS